MFHCSTFSDDPVLDGGGGGCDVPAPSATVSTGRKGNETPTGDPEGNDRATARLEGPSARGAAIHCRTLRALFFTQVSNFQ